MTKFAIITLMLWCGLSVYADTVSEYAPVTARMKIESHFASKSVVLASQSSVPPIPIPMGARHIQPVSWSNVRYSFGIVENIEQ